MRITNYFSIYFILLSLGFILTTLIGIANNYSQIPYLDMWEGTIKFFEKITNGNYLAFWEQHNEHRIVFSKIFFWVDLKFFNGTFYLSHTVILIIQFLTALVFFKSIDNLYPQKNKLAVKSILQAIIIIFCFSWVQNENFIWPFQIQFVAASLFPLLLFYISFELKSSKVTFIFSIFIALFASFNMANGLLLWPFLIIISYLTKQPLRRKITYIILSLLTFSVYFNDYHSVSRHGNLLDLLKTDTLNLFNYILSYLGGPVFWLTGGNRTLPLFIGFVVIIISIVYFIIYLKDSKDNGFVNFLIFSLLFFELSAIAISTRAVFGIEQSVSSRYSTPVLQIWLILILLTVYYLRHKVRVQFQMAFFFFSTLIFIPYQIVYTFKTSDNAYQKNLALLALEMGINDSLQLRYIYNDKFSNLVEIYNSVNSSKFPNLKYNQIFSNSKNISHHRIDTLESHIFKLIKFNPVRENPNFYKINCSAKIDTLNGNHLFYFLNEYGDIVGYSILKSLNADQVGTSNSSAIIEGYLHSSYINMVKELQLYSKNEF